MYNLFYEEPQNDRWFRYDRYPRKFLRRLLRGPEPIGGVKRWFVNLCLGLDELQIPYTINDYKALRKNPQDWALVVGKPHVVDKIPAGTQIIYGPGIAAHPLESDFWTRRPNIRHLMISCDWFMKMYKRDLPIDVPGSIWASGIETDRWKPSADTAFKNTILIYDKIRWNRETYVPELLEPIRQRLSAEGINIRYIRYGQYQEENFRKLLHEVDGMIFLCEHETQGFAYLQTLASGVPILAWDRGGYWQDPSLYPQSVQFEPVTSVPYWEERCGERFADLNAFNASFSRYWDLVIQEKYTPRNYVVEHFRLAEAASRYISIIDNIIKHESSLSL